MKKVHAATQHSLLALLMLVLVWVIVAQLVRPRERSSLGRYPFRVVSGGKDTLFKWNYKIESLEQAAARLNMPQLVRISMLELARADEFARGLVGEQARPAPAETTITLLTVQRNATDIFMAVFLAADSTNEGRMLALTGLMQTDPQSFKVASDWIKNSSARIRWQSGCTRQIVPASDCIDYLRHWHRRMKIGG